MKKVIEYRVICVYSNGYTFEIIPFGEPTLKDQKNVFRSCKKMPEFEDCKLILNKEIYFESEDGENDTEGNIYESKDIAVWRGKYYECDESNISEKQLEIMRLGLRGMH